MVWESHTRTKRNAKMRALATESERCGRRAEGAGVVDQRQADQSTSERASASEEEIDRWGAHRATARWLWVATRFIQNNTRVEYRATDMFVSQGHRRRVVVCRGIHGGIGRARAGQRRCNSESTAISPTRDSSGRAHRAAVGAVLAITHSVSKEGCMKVIRALPSC
jgi:hypothetical protein